MFHKEYSVAVATASAWLDEPNEDLTGIAIIIRSLITDVAQLEAELDDERDLRYKIQNETSKRIYELEAIKAKYRNEAVDYRERIRELEAENAKLKRALEKQALVDEVSHKYMGYARHGYGCTRDQLDKGNVCTCGLFAIQLELLDALADTEEHVDCPKAIGKPRWCECHGFQYPIADTQEKDKGYFESLRQCLNCNAFLRGDETCECERKTMERST